MPIFQLPPTSTTYAFSEDSFDLGFLCMDIIPSVKKLIITPENKIVSLGQAVVITCVVVENSTTIGQEFNFNPDNPPDIEIYNPDGTVKQAYASMNFIQDGYYIYQHQVATNDQKGFYTGKIKCSNGSMLCETEQLGLFRVD